MLPWMLAALPPVPCGNPTMPPPIAVVAPPDVQRGGGSRLNWEAFGNHANQQVSDHFIVKWGNDGGIDAGAVADLLDALEDSLELYVDDLSLTNPTFEDWYFNVYIGNTGPNTPEIESAGGYYWYDPEGVPMLVISPDTMQSPTYLDITASHELFHAVQWATALFPYEGDSAWYIESTATWASSRMYPDNLDFAVFIGGYLLLPHRPLASFQYPEGFALDEFHQYGAFLFPYYVSEQVLDASAIAETWARPIHPDPIESLAVVLDQRGLDLDEVWLDHIAANTMYDYRHGDWFRAAVQGWADFYEGGRAVTESLDRADADGTWQTVPARYLPGRYGYNLVEMPLLRDGSITIEARFESTGTQDTPASWGGRVALRRDGDITYLPLDIEDGEASVTIDDVEGISEAWLVVGAWSEALVPVSSGEVFPWEYAVTLVRAEPTVVDEDPVDGGEEPAACACQGGGAASGWWLMMVGLLVRRRR